MAVKIRLTRMGKIRAPYYRIVVADARTKRDGRAIEEIGQYDPKQEPSLIRVNSERVAYWLSVGAQPTEPVKALLKVTGDWQRFTGEPAPPPMKTAPPKPDKKALFEAAAKEAAGEPRAEATTSRKRSGKHDKGAETTPAAEAAPDAAASADEPAGGASTAAESQDATTDATPSA
ncbi:SSU ribosomal protein S16P [Acidothermus cellulolyticus 11B]|uniref:Small ribosomal subunit protein bS16 n=1 Tax=Acidothermus cellulolyticus (strain ATCC 43068 / DSM 8971 / 11B) TaxID=351607 RepID=RS16_ACIC1|nr:30S ribosomal protein S16 [Acidothermus cellulolyticus]A0LV73.1 RecName: Full=Small ribosomal subunit protein bS16; AltName: Full=30S ribosomal protein S16 [Acidothermus cellulolyticus 11B]ABK53333.1 SSU ribosomal protein S16P [Acidothermus cellulolyticus 11B]